ncbi:TetR/AcrR family transcriptional regulator [Lactiplantibacillus sp. WILCCON 0030]|uniref:TetR/AcrR family transcriptional regulator n=1 Tax=Lactiplantibacillus brownii TaxID=3069269 RepID=A0ABU1ABF6_9LACO|nr:TetR/AcrR family transcriptional regulator [Lactiplantibacillus brownii]MDQ7938286.1 TetR/AcrR family transcriptional regulator [Lactiplantibacillus brownii]
MAADIFVNYHDWLDRQVMPKGQKATLIAAMTSFSEQGFDGTTTNDIAKHAQISQATIFKYYHTKQDLLVAVVKPVMANLFPEYRDQFFAGLAQYTTLETMIRYIVTDRYHFIMANAEAVKIIAVEMMISPEMRQLLKQLFLTSDNNFLGQLVLLFRRTNEVRSDIDAADILRLLAGQLVGYIIQMKYAPGLVLAETQALPKIIDQIVRAIRK